MKNLIKAASYNIHSCVGTDKKYSPERIAEVIKDISPHVIGLQEVDTGYRIKTGGNQLSVIQSLTGMESIAGPAIIHGDYFYGNAILTKLPVKGTRRYDLSIGTYEPRGLLDTDLQLNGKKIRFMVTHLGLRPMERIKQAKIIIDVLNEYNDNQLTFLCGDFNDFFPLKFAIKLIRRHMDKTRNVRTFPSKFPIFSLDKIWILSGKTEARKLVTVRNEMTRVASDHLPVYTEL